MDKVAKPQGLIRYSTERALEKKWSPKQIAKRVLRPRVLIYTSLLLAIMVAFVASLATRNPVKLDVIRDRGSMGREVENDMIENVYRLQIMNTAETPHVFVIGATGIESLHVAEPTEAALDGATTRAVAVRVRIRHGEGEKGANPIEFSITAKDDPTLRVTEEAVFIVPRR